MEIKILGIGCPRCIRLEEVAREAAQELGVDATFTKVKNMNEIMQYPISSTPGLVINEKVVSSGRIPAKEEIMGWIQEATS